MSRHKALIALVLLALISGTAASCSMPSWMNFPSSTEVTSITTMPPVETTTETTIATETTIQETTMESAETSETETSLEDMVSLFVTDIKGALLGREISAAESSADIIHLSNGELTPSDFVHSIILSDEFTNLNLTDSQFISRLNDTLLGGSLGPGQRVLISTNLQESSSREEVVTMVLSSASFRNLCASYMLDSSYEPHYLSDTSEIYDIVSGISGEETITTMGGYLPSEEILSGINNEIETLGQTYRRVGFLLIDVSTGRGIAYNIDRPFYSASAIKGPYAASLCYYQPDVIGDYASTLSNMLINSDNDAYTRLYRNFRRPYIEAWADEAQVPQDSIMWKYPKIPTRDLFRLWLRNYQFFHDGSPQGEIVETWMREPAYSLIHSELGDMYITVSKAGWLVDDDPSHTTAVDAGIVYATSGTYIVVIESNCVCTVDPLRPLMQLLNSAHDEMMSF